MNQVSAPVRIVALVGLLAAAGVGLYTFMQSTAGSAGGGGSTGLSTLRPVQEAKGVAARLSAHNVATARGKLATPARTGAKPTQPVPVKPRAATTPVAAPVHAKSKPAAGSPTTIASLLRDHKVVVVLLYDPQSKVDQYSVSEAELGARAANAGFILVNVLDQRAAAPFTKQYGVLQDPSVLFFARPGKLAQKLVGFADHDSVAQAATNVALGLVRTGSS